MDPYNHSGLHRAIYAEDEDHFGFIDNVVLRPLIERFTTVSAREWAQLKALFDKVRIIFLMMLGSVEQLQRLQFSEFVRVQSLRSPCIACTDLQRRTERAT